MLEQGESQRQEHEKLAEVISKIKSDKIILMGPRVSEYTLPKLNSILRLRSGQELKTQK